MAKIMHKATISLDSRTIDIELFPRVGSVTLTITTDEGYRSLLLSTEEAQQLAQFFWDISWNLKDVEEENE